MNAAVLYIERDDVFCRLKVLRRCESKRKRGPRYECGCQCGKIVRVKGYLVLDLTICAGMIGYIIGVYLFWSQL